MYLLCILCALTRAGSICVKSTKHHSWLCKGNSCKYVPFLLLLPQSVVSCNFTPLQQPGHLANAPYTSFRQEMSEVCYISLTTLQANPRQIGDPLREGQDYQADIPAMLGRPPAAQEEPLRWEPGPIFEEAMASMEGPEREAAEMIPLYFCSDAFELTIGGG